MDVYSLKAFRYFIVDIRYSVLKGKPNIQYPISNTN